MRKQDESAEEPRNYMAASDADDAKEVRTFFRWSASDTIERQMPRLAYHVERLVVLYGITLLYGASGAMKSFIAQAIASAVARDAPVFGLAVQPGPVLYISAEGVSGLGVRLRGYRQGAGMDQELPRRLQWTTAPVRLLQPGVVDRLCTDVEAVRALHAPKQYDAPVLVVIDTIGACMAGDGDENNSRDMQRLTEALRQLTEVKASVLAIHHTVKNSQQDRGHGSLRDRADLMIHARLS